MRVIVGVGPLGLPVREVSPVRRHPFALGSPEVGIGSRVPPLEILHLRAAKCVLWVPTVVPGLVIVRVRVGATRGLQHLVQQVVAQLGLVPHPLVVPVRCGGTMPALPHPVPRSAFLVELVRALDRPGAPLFLAAALASLLLHCTPILGLLPGHFVLSFS
jgi:hypothetical protein